MFLTELTPVAQKLLQQPIAFAGGFCSGIFKLNLDEEPLSAWLDKQGYTPGQTTNKTSNDKNGNKPQSISID